MIALPKHLDTSNVARFPHMAFCRSSPQRRAYGNNGWLGIAQIWASGSHITQGVVKLNDTYFNTPTYDTGSWRQFVMCQEIGHTFGLDHQDENFNNANLGSCMDYTNNPSSNQHPNTHDYDQLESIYSHVDGTTTVGMSTGAQAQPPSMSDIDFEGPKLDRGRRTRPRPLSTAR